MNKDNKVVIFDTTMRDGQQCPGAGMGFEENLQYARLAAKLGIDVIEAGFPSASSTDFQIVKTVADEFATMKTSPVVAGLSQMRGNQIEMTIRALESVAKVGRGRLHFYLPVDPNLMDASLGAHGSDRTALLNEAAKFCRMACQAGLEVEFSPEGYSRQGENFDFVTDLIRAVVDAGATTINCPDTIGGAFHAQKDYFVDLMQRHAEIIDCEFPNNNVIWSCHCHNDFGLALPNSLNAIFEGPARQIECCINGVGERAGNAPLEQCVVAIKHFGACYKENLQTNIKTEYLKEVSDFVATNMLQRQPNYPICGENASRHTSGGHTNAILKNPLVYQPFDPAEVGQKITLVFGPLSGGNHAKGIIKDHGYLCLPSEQAEIAQYIKDFYADRRKGITDAELIDAYKDYRSPIKVDNFSYKKCGNKLSIRFEGQFFGKKGVISESIESAGSPLAVLKHLIDREFEQKITLINYDSISDGPSIDAKDSSKIYLKMQNGAVYEGHGNDQDIQISAMKALIDATNKAYVEENYRIIHVHPSVEESQRLQASIDKRLAGNTRLNLDTYVVDNGRNVDVTNRGQEL